MSEKQALHPHSLSIASVPRKWLALMGFALLLLVLLAVWLVSAASAPVTQDAPEAEKVMAAQADTPFQVMIPAYMPRDFDRANMQIDVQKSGPGNEPMVELTYRTKKGGVLFVQQWVPVNPEIEILSGSRPVETKWGKGWLLTQGDAGLIAMWVDVGATRVAVYTPNAITLKKEQILEMVDTLGPASNRQVFSFVLSTPQVVAAQPPAPFEVPVNADGVQEFTLVVTPGGYDPIRFSVKQGVPVKMTFRMLGEVGCGDTLIFPADPSNPSSLQLVDEADKQELVFTPTVAGEFQFHCSHLMFRGLMVVRP